ncbi:MAG TPA: transposase, partial [Lachnospiraceae bacterium]|nr:transposase [Lachnospiraceae bacterium]
MKADTITKDYVKDASIFADIFNYYIYGGRQVILPEQLAERDSAKMALPYGTDGAVVPVQKFRDVQKLYAAMTDGKVEYVLYGAENQSEIHYAMAVKNNLYDALEYAGQVEEAAKSHRKKMKRKKEQEETLTDENKKTPNTGEFLSGFWKEDRLIPSITVTIFFGSEEWDGPLSLFDMMDVSDPEVLACMDNYHVRLIAPAQMADDEIMKFQSSLREVMLFI